MFVVSWIQDGVIDTRIYSERKYAERLANWCKLNGYKYCFREETVDREILAYDVFEVREINTESNWFALQ